MAAIKYAAFAVAIMCIFPPVLHAADPIVERFKTLSPSVGALYAQETNGDIKFLCSATAIDRVDGETVILTAYHCLQKGVSYRINFGDDVLRPVRAWKVPHYEVNREKHPRKFNEPETDMALFLMPGVDVPIIPVAENSTVETGSPVAMVGYPLGVAKIAYQGIVSGRFDRLGADQYDYLLLQIFASPGSSGSSVVNVETGEVIGILVSGKQSFGLPVLFATPIEYRRYLMAVRADEQTPGREAAEEAEEK